MALNINNTTPGPSLDPFKLVKITKDNISDYPGLGEKCIGYNLFVNHFVKLVVDKSHVIAKKISMFSLEMKLLNF